MNGRARGIALAVCLGTLALAEIPALAWWPARNGGTWHPPLSTLDGLQRHLERETSIGFFVERSGLYRVSARWSYDPVASQLFLYTDQFKLSRPLNRLIAAADTSRSPTLTVNLSAGTVYYAVVSAEDFGPDDVHIAVDGPGQAELSECYLLDQIDYGLVESDDCFQAQDLRFSLRAGAREGPCVHSGVAHQTREGVDFSCSDGADWELSVRILDRCDRNGHYWIVANRLVNRPWVITALDQHNQIRKTWELAASRLEENLVDRTAFPCNFLRAAKPQ
jgi:hypothetical protein